MALFGLFMFIVFLTLSIFIVWYFKKYEPVYRQRTRPIVVQYDIPRDLTPSQVGAVYQEKNNMDKLIVSEITALENLGYIAIIKDKNKKIIGSAISYLVLGILGELVYLTIAGAVLVGFGVIFYSAHSYFLFVILVIALLFVISIFKRLKKVFIKFRIESQKFDIKINKNIQDLPPVPNHLTDLLKYITEGYSSNQNFQFNYKAYYSKIFNKIIESLPADHLAQRSIFHKKYYKVQKRKRTVGENFILWFLFLTIGLTPTIMLVAFLCTDGKEMIEKYPNQSLFVVATSLLIYAILRLRKYLVNKVFYKTDLWYEIMGLREYIKVAEIERIKFQDDPKNSLNIYSRLLPYAVVFGLEDKWTKTFSTVLELKIFNR